MQGDNSLEEMRVKTRQRQTVPEYMINFNVRIMKQEEEKQ